MILRKLCSILPVILIACCGALEAEEKAATLSAEQVEQLITRLGDNDYRVREKATEVLESLGDEIHPQLQNSLQANQNSEAERRLRMLLAGAADRRMIAPALCVSQYCVAVCDGDEGAARKCLSRDFLERLDSAGNGPTPPVAGATSFRVDAVGRKAFVGNTTIIGSTWFYERKGEPLQLSISFLLKQEVDGWKVSLIEEPGIIKSSTSVFR